MDLFSFLLGLIPFAGAAIGWIVDRSKRKKDMLRNMQDSIDLLSEKYTSVLDAWTLAKSENQKLIEGQASMLVELKKLRFENAGLKSDMEELKAENTSLKRMISELKSQLKK
ncbi:MAG: hypothetical protein RR328_04765 [Bacteroidales bacterium]